MKVTFTLLVAAVITFFSSCQKEVNFLNEKVDIQKIEACEVQTQNPDGNSYSGTSITSVNYSKKNCGLIPLSTGSYWVYLDSVYTNGVFTMAKFDTLRFSSTWKTPDGLIWWESNIEVGIPGLLYANDSTIFGLESRYFADENIKDVKKDFSLFSGDSIRYLTHFEDMAALGRSVKMPASFKTPAGSFSDCVYFEKNARNYRRDQVIIKPGIGVVKYIYEEAPMSSISLKLQNIMTLVDYHIE